MIRRKTNIIGTSLILIELCDFLMRTASNINFTLTPVAQGPVPSSQSMLQRIINIIQQCYVVNNFYIQVTIICIPSALIQCFYVYI